MPSAYSARGRFVLQAPGEGLNLWGVILNQGVFALVDEARAKRLAFTLSGNKTLTTALGASDEARSAFLDITSGSGGTVTIPSVEWTYVVRNAATGPVIITTGAGEIANVAPGSVVTVACDAANVRLARDAEMATRAYVQGLAFGSVGGLPDVTGNPGKFVFSDGVSASWKYVTVADVPGLATTLTDLQAADIATLAAAKALAIAFAVAL